LIGILAVALALLIAVVCYIGAFALVIRLGEVHQAGGVFTISQQDPHHGIKAIRYEPASK
jgi:hypothetical protein